jgi:1-acyl-sn-glycerol-3-phosphate acyltransferase
MARRSGSAGGGGAAKPGRRSPPPMPRASLAEAVVSGARGRAEAHTEPGRESPHAEFPVDRDLREKLRPLVGFLFRRWWRVALRGIENVPEKGPAILIGNHSGAIPVDAVMVAYALDCEDHQRSPRRCARVLYDKFIEGIPVLADAYRRCGAVPARYAVADAMLARGEAIVIFPEGIGGVAKLFEDRYKLQRFSTSAARLAIKHKAPIVPFAVIGAEEAYPVVGRSEEGGHALGAPYLPITPFFPAFGPLGVLPLPTRWSLTFGRRIALHREQRFRASDDFQSMTERLRRSVAVLIERGLEERRSVFLG